MSNKIVYPRYCTCGKEIAYKQLWYKHTKSCKLYYKHHFLEEDTCESDDLIRKIQELEKQIQQLKHTGKHEVYTSQTTNVQNNNNIQNQQNINISIHLPGKEDMSHISEDMKEHCLKQCNEGVLRLVKDVLFNPNKPQNRNMRIKTMKDFYNGCIEVLGPDGWEPTMKHPAYGRVWKQMFKELDNLFGLIEWEGDDYMEDRLGNKKDEVARFISDNQHLVGRQDDEVPKKYVKPIDCMIMKCYEYAKKMHSDERNYICVE